MILYGKEYDDILSNKEYYNNIDDYTLRWFNYKVGYRHIPGFAYADLDTNTNQIIVYVKKSRCNIAVSIEQYNSDISLDLKQVKDTTRKEKSYHIQYKYLKHEQT